MRTAITLQFTFRFSSSGLIHSSYASENHQHTVQISALAFHVKYANCANELPTERIPSRTAGKDILID